MAQIFASERSTAAPARRSASGRSAANARGSSLAELQVRADNGPATEGLRQLRALASDTPRQRVEDEEMMQAKATSRDGLTLQRLEEEEPLQGKAASSEGMALQRIEDEEPLQGRAINANGLPVQLQGNIEAMSGVDMSGVRVEYNSSAPAAVGAHAFAQGQDIHLASGQERHLPHEAWHVVQQAQGRVRPTGAVGGAAINDDPGLEHEADRMGARAAQMRREPGRTRGA